MQVDGRGARSEGGLGVGLALVKALVALHGGTVVARSDGLGRGCEFEVRLPIAEAPPQTAEDPVPEALNRKLRLLLIDDDEDLAESMAELLRSWGHDVAVMSDPRDAIESAVTSTPDVVVIDIGMPGIDGYEVARELRARLTGERRARLIALTGYCQPADRRRAREAGFDLHFGKPVDFEALRTALEEERLVATTALGA